jgi:Na+-driven multidrug efflux pump
MVIFSINRVLCSYFAGTGKPEYGTYTSIASFFFMLGLTAIMVPKFGLIGAPLASLIAFIASSVLAIIIFIKSTHIGFRDIVIIKKDDFKRYSAIITQIINKPNPQQL